MLRRLTRLCADDDESKVAFSVTIIIVIIITCIDYYCMNIGAFRKTMQYRNANKH